MKVILFGATGMVGEGVLLTTLAHPDVEYVLAVGRRACGLSHPRLKELLHQDFFDWSSRTEELKGYDACFFCLGTSSAGMEARAYERVTYELTMRVATALVEANPEMTFAYVSGAGTDSTEQGRSRWARVKGRTENALGRLTFRAVHNVRPGLIRPLPQQRRAGWMLRLVAWPFPLWRRLFPHMAMTVEEIAWAMIRASREKDPRRILEVVDMHELARAEANSVSMATLSEEG